MNFIPGISHFFSSSVIRHPSSVILDLWGCVHDGTALYPGAKDCLRQLKAAGKKVIFLSNAPRRNTKVVAVLENLGITPDLYDAVLSSGEAGYRLFEARSAKEGLPATYFYIGPPKDEDVLDGLPMRPAPVAEAEFILNVGFGSEAQVASDWHAPLREALARGLAMVCLNPDLEVVKLTGERFPCAGVIAREYEQLGGAVTYIGKPHAEVYSMALAMLGCAREQVVAVGDALHTDILGAKRAGITSVLVTGGILAQELREVSEVHVREWLAMQDVQPDFVMPGLVW